MIILTGGSWGVGEWGREGELTGPGIGQYLMLHDEVVNLCTGAQGNEQAIQRLSQFFDRYCVNEFDEVYWLVSCPSLGQNVQDLVHSQISIPQHLDAWLHHSLDRAQHIAQRHSVRIRLIGAACDLVGIDISRHSNLEIAVESWGRLLMPDYAVSRYKPMQHWEDLGERLRQHRVDLLPGWLEVTEQSLAKHDCWQNMNQRYFSTDGQHPDRHAHRVLRDHLWPQWANKF